MAKSKIEWTGHTWNPTVGCSKKSTGCKNCFAERMAKRLQAMGRPEYQGTVNGNGRWTGVVNLAPERLEEPLRRKKPTTWFVDSMSDLFHESIPLQWQTDIFEVMVKASWHTFQVLTKRPDVMLARWNDIGTGVAYRMGKQREPGFWPPPNVWLGVSAENQQAADERIPLLLRTPAAVRFVSAEPLLGPIDLSLYLAVQEAIGPWEFKQRLNWVIAGGESGPQARPCHPDWLRQLRDGCQEAGVAFFFKQYGMFIHASQAIPGVHYSESEPPPTGDNFLKCTSKHAAGRLLDGREHNEMPQ